MLINGQPADRVESMVVTMGVAPEDAAAVVSAARKRITVAADYARDEQIGSAVMRLNDLYAKSIMSQDIRTALQAQRELNRLLDLYAGRVEAKADDSDGGEARRQLEMVAGHLLPLNLADPTYPIEEHARLAAQRIRGVSA